jgi:ComF family protein
VLVHSLKYGGTTAVAPAMARQMAVALGGERFDARTVVPVPLATMRRRTRGYNQAEELARALGRALRLPVETRLLTRTRHTPQQARSSSASQRHRNVEGAFAAREELAGSRILLVDDVTTTGATFAAAATALRAAGAQCVWCVAFARED